MTDGYDEESNQIANQSQDTSGLYNQNCFRREHILNRNSWSGINEKNHAKFLFVVDLIQFN